MAKTRLNLIDIAMRDIEDCPEELVEDHIDLRLLQACTLRHLQLARSALEGGANVNTRRIDHMTPLHIAAEHGDVDLIQLICEQASIQLDSKTMHGLTALHTAALLGNTEALEKLLEKGATVNCRDNLGRYPLHYSALQRDIEGAGILIANEAEVNVYDVFQESPLYVSVIKQPCLLMVRLLLSHGASITFSPMMESLELLLEAVLASPRFLNFEMIKFIIRQGACIDTCDDVGRRTPLHIVAMNGNHKLATYLIKIGANLNAKNSAGRTPLDVAIICQNWKIARLIDSALKENLEVYSSSSLSTTMCSSSTIFEYLNNK